MEEIIFSIFDNELLEVETNEEGSYCYWAANELLERLSARSLVPPILIVDDFRDEMKLYSEKPHKGAEMFHVAMRLADTVIGLAVA